MNFDLIRALDESNFFFNGSVYLQKKVVEKTQRDRERLLLDSSSNSLLAALSTEFNFFDAINNGQKSDSFIKTKIKNIYLSAADFKNSDFESEDFFINEKKRLAKEFLKGDILILINKTNLGTDISCDIANSSIIYLSLENGINFGFIANKFVIDFLYELNNKKGVYDTDA